MLAFAGLGNEETASDFGNRGLGDFSGAQVCMEEAQQPDPGAPGESKTLCHTTLLSRACLGCCLGGV